MKVKHIFTLGILLNVLICLGQSKSGKFVLVLDAGHGGKDPGNSYHGFVEKEIALKTTLKVGEYLEKRKDFEVIFTRKSDVFIELVNRPKIANNQNANLFVSIHCNGVANFEPSGTETFVMGLSRADMNFEVAKKENSVMLLEDNYKNNYKGYDPNKPENLIGIKILQEDNLNNSISLASEIEGNFSNKLNRKSRGVKQQPLWVLDASSMPGVLIELGFLSNKDEGGFLNTEAGQDKMARQIAEAIISYKEKYFGELVLSEKNVEVEKKDKNNSKIESVVAESSNKETYKIQLFATSKKRELTSSVFKGLTNISFTYENNLYKYFCGNLKDMEEAKNKCAEVQKLGFKDAFIVNFAN